MVNTVFITFLGTASAVPTPTRNHSSLVLRLDGRLWFFDAGEGTQHQLMQSQLGYGKVDKIFLTHLHGDHCFGLPGLICTLSQAAASSRSNSGNEIGDETREKSDKVFEIFGPKGTRAYVRNALKFSRSRLGARYVVHELLSSDESAGEEKELHDDEIPGRNIQLLTDRESGHTHWDVCIDEETKIVVTAAPIRHAVPCIGYVLQEPSHPGHIKIDSLLPHLERNTEALASMGIKQPRSLVRNLKAGETLTLPDGTVLNPADYTSPDTPGRKLVILGDTCDPSAISHLARNPDLLIHECTNACISTDIAAGLSAEGVREVTISHGHSTPEMAGEFARGIGAKRLALNHFSSRYKGDEGEESLKIMDDIRALAVQAFGSEEVVCARDFMEIEIKRRKD